MKMKICFFFFLLITLRAQAAAFKISTSPEGADVFIKKRSEDTPLKLGIAPINMTLEELKNKFNLETTFFIQVSREGHETTSIMLAPLSNSDIDIKLKLPLSKDIVITRKFDNIMANLFEAQRLTRDKNYDQALKMLEQVENEEKHLSVVSEMRGGIYYLKKDFNTALSYYRKAFSINAENKDAYSMKLYLEKSLGIKNE